jgi:hypothetical protein
LVPAYVFLAEDITVKMADNNSRTLERIASIAKKPVAWGLVLNESKGPSKLVAKLGGPSVPEIKSFLCRIAESQGMNEAFVEIVMSAGINLLA